MKFEEDYGAEQDRSAPGLSLRDLVAPLFRYRRAGLLVAFAILIATATAVFMTPRNYAAEMTLLVKRERADTVVSPGPESATQTRGDVTEGELNSEVELLKSRDLLGQVVTATGLIKAKDGDSNAVPRPDAVAVSLAQAVREFSSKLEVTALKKTSLIKVVYNSSDPVMAAKVLSELGSRYLERHLALHRPAGAYEFFSAQTDRFKAELSEAEARLKAYGREQQVVTADDEKQNALRQLAEFEALLQQTRTQVADSTRRLGELENAARSVPMRQTTQVRTSRNSQLITELRAKVLELESQASTMRRKFAPAYPPLVEVEAQLGESKAALEATEQRPLTEETTDENPTHQWLENERARVAIERGAALARADSIASSVRLYQDKAIQLEEKGSVQQELRRTMKNAEDNYQLYLRKQEEARISDALDRTRISNVAIADAPTVPALPSRSGRTKLLLLGCVLAAILGAATTYVLDYLRPHFATPSEVESALDIPVLATLRAVQP